MESMIDLWKLSRPVTEEHAYRSPYLYVAYKNQLKHIRLVSAGELVKLKASSSFPTHVLNFIQQHEEVMVIANIVRNYIVQLVLRGVREKGFTVFAPSIVPFYGIGRFDPNFQYGDPIVLVEGVLDCESVRAIYPNVMSLLTASLTNFQMAVLETMTNRIVLCLDNDVSGERGSKRAYNKLKEKGFSVDFIKLLPTMKDAGNLIEWDMAGNLYELSFAESYLRTQIALKTTTPQRRALHDSPR